MMVVNLSKAEPPDMTHVSVFFIPKPMFEDLTPYMFIASMNINKLTEKGMQVTIVFLNSITKSNIGISDTDCKKMTAKIIRNMFRMGLKNSRNLNIKDDAEFSNIEFKDRVLSVSRIEDLVYRYAFVIAKRMGCDAILDNSDSKNIWMKIDDNSGITLFTFPYFKDPSADYLKFNDNLARFIQKCNRFGRKNKKILADAMKTYEGIPLSKKIPFSKLMKNVWTKINRYKISRLPLFVDSTNMIKIAYILANKARVRILNILCDGGDYTRNIAKRIGASPSFVAYHLKILKDAGIVEERTYKNRKIYYTPYTDIYFKLKTKKGGGKHVS
jgi:DNA-binding transcriptional ArsR family regulator